MQRESAWCVARNDASKSAGWGDSLLWDLMFVWVLMKQTVFVAAVRELCKVPVFEISFVQTPCLAIHPEICLTIV
jgi:hypothetical protein